MGLSAIGIVSKNVDETLRFFKTLGLELKKEGEGDHFEGTTSTGLRLMVDSLDLIQKINPDFKMSDGGGIVLCFEEDSAQAVDRLYAQVVDAGFQSVKAPWDAFWGQRYASVKDPGGNQVDLFATL